MTKIDCRRSLLGPPLFSLIGIIYNPAAGAEQPEPGIYFVLGRNRVCKNEGGMGESGQYNHPPERLPANSRQTYARPRPWGKMGGYRPNHKNYK